MNDTDDEGQWHLQLHRVSDEEFEKRMDEEKFRCGRRSDSEGAKDVRESEASYRTQLHTSHSVGLPIVSMRILERIDDEKEAVRLNKQRWKEMQENE